MKIAEQVIHRVRQFEEKYSRYQPNSLLSKINRLAGSKTPISIDDETTQLLNYAQTLYEQSDGLFDITSGVLRQVWDFKAHQLPTESLIEDTLPLIGWNKVQWNPSNIELPLTGMEIDFGGFGKEYAADLCAKICAEAGIEYGLINLGGDISIIGPNPDNTPWKVGIQNPRKPGEAITTLDLWSGGIASSGDYERFMIVDGIRYSHLLNPKSGQSMQPYYSGISVIAPSCLVAGSFTTLALLKSESDPHWIQQTGLSYITIDQAMRIETYNQELASQAAPVVDQ